VPDLDLRTHLVDDVVGWWLRHGPDDLQGGVFTCWDNAGERLLSTDKYTWSQGRWIWLTARLADSVARGALASAQDRLDSERLLALARSTADFVRRHALLPDGTTAYVTDRTGRPKEPAPGAGLHTSVFADCFVALGLAALARLDGDRAAARLAEDLLHSADARVRAGRARTDPYPVHPAFAAFSLPMILLGTATEVHQATGSPGSAEVATQAARTIVTWFRDGADVRELRPNPRGFDDTLLARHRTPGHVLECAWFLVHAADTVPGVAGVLGDWPTWLPTVAAHALALGWDEQDGGLFRYTDVDGGEPRGRLLDDPYERLVRDTWDTKLWWPHAEALYATALLARRCRAADRSAPAAELTAWHDRLRAYTFATFPAGPGREWIQIRRRDGAPLDQTVALPVKDPFHVARALLLMVEIDEPGERTNP
jgi:N-acylglucosamine 2-epimerase